MSKNRIGQYRSVKSQTPRSEGFVGSAGYEILNEEANSYRDLVFNFNEEIKKGEDYILELDLPRDIVYTNSFTVKLCGGNNQDGTTSYQFLDELSVPPSSSGEEVKPVYRVVLYDDNSGTTKADIALELPDDPQEGVLYYAKEDEVGTGKDSYYLGKNRLTRYNDVILVKTWWKSGESASDEVEHVTIPFSPIVSGLNKIIVEMARDTIDTNITYTAQDDNDNNSQKDYSGRYVKKDLAACQIIKVPDIKANMGVTGSLSKIGVWGPVGMSMMINHEHIRIGRSGYYEYSTLPITSFGVLDDETYTVDYVYSA